MKRKKFFLLGLTLTCLTAVCSIVCCCLAISALKQETTATMFRLVGQVQSQYPDIGDDTIAALLQSQESAPGHLERYGFYPDQWISERGKQTAWILVGICAGSCLCTGGVIGIVVLQSRRQQRQSLQALTDTLITINSGNYQLDIDQNTEDEDSLLKNEIYKTTVLLREQAEHARKEELLLKDALSDISHQIKTPLASSRILLENLLSQEQIPQDRQREVLHALLRSNRQIGFLVQNLLTLSKLDANAITLKQETVSVRELLERCVEHTEILAELREVAVTLQCDPAVTLQGDEKWLAEAVTNLLKNCLEHSPPGTQVELAAAENPQYTKLTVTDHGTGIPTEELPHIFERFYRGRCAPPESVGIGLAMAKTIIEKNGGYLSASSRMGKGTQFQIRFYKQRLV